MCNDKRYQAEYYKKNKQRLKEYKKQYYEKNKENYRKRSKEKYELNRDRMRSRHLEYYYKNREKILARQKKWREDNKETVRANYIKRLANRTEEAKLLAKQVQKMRFALWYNLKTRGKSKSKYLESITGCSNQTLYDHLVSTWEKRYGSKWDGQPCNVDHIVPLVTANTKEEKEKLCFYKNLQLLTQEDNMRKNAKLDIPPRV